MAIARRDSRREETAGFGSAALNSSVLRCGICASKWIVVGSNQKKIQRRISWEFAGVGGDLHLGQSV